MNDEIEYEYVMLDEDEDARYEQEDFSWLDE